MRTVVLDTETTGLEVERGHRIIEIGCVEMVNRRLTGQRLHVYLNPEREIDEGASRVHGFTWDMLKDKPTFREVADDFVSFIRDAEVIIHNAPFDVGFLNAELARLSRDPMEKLVATVTDSMRIARELHPGQSKSLDALCGRYGVSNEHRVFHGALLDAELLAEVYLAMTRGQETFDDLLEEDPNDLPPLDPGLLSRLIVIEPTPEEIAAHEAMLDEIDKICPGGSIWRRVKASAT